MSSSSENETLCRDNLADSLPCNSFGFPVPAINLEPACNQVLCYSAVLRVLQERPCELYRVGRLSVRQHRDPHFPVDPRRQRLFLAGEKAGGVASPEDFGALF